MLQKSFHGWSIQPEIQKLTAIRTPSPRLNPVRESPGSPARFTPLSSLSPRPRLFFRQQDLRPASHFPFTVQTSKYSLSTSSVGVDDGREHDGDGEGSGRRRSGTVFTCVSEDGECDVYLVPTKPGSQELCEEVSVWITYCMPQVVALQSCQGDAGAITLEWLKRNPKVVNKLDVYPGQERFVPFDEAMKYGGKFIPGDRPDKVADKIEAYLGRGFRVAYEEAMKYGVNVMRDLFGPFSKAVLLSQCRKWSLCERIDLIHSALSLEMYENRWKGRSEKPAVSTIRKLLYLVISLRRFREKPFWEKIKSIHLSLLIAQHENLLEGPLKKLAVSTVKMLSSLGVSVAGVAILCGIYFGRKK